MCACISALYSIQHSSEDDSSGKHWLSVSSPNGLADVHWLHVGSQNGSPRIEKDKRDVFVKGRIQDVRKQFQVGASCNSTSITAVEPLGRQMTVS